MTLGKMKAKAEAATKGPWVAYNRGIGWEVRNTDGIELHDGFRETFTEADATYIATFHPKRVLALLAVVEATRIAMSHCPYVSIWYEDKERIIAALAELEKVP